VIEDLRSKIEDPDSRTAAPDFGSLILDLRSEGAVMPDQDTTVAALKKVMADFVAAREWERYHDPKNLAASIAIEAAELMEHFQWLRSDELPAVRKDPKQMTEIREEIADILAYILSFANAMDIDLSTALQSKMVRNEEKYPAERFRGRFKAD
jgi:NTP pyrophosphatase (non-canonical NTP hydrolase)